MLKSLDSYTVTLTYDNDHLPQKIKHSPLDPLKRSDYKDFQFWYHPFVYKHVQDFFKRLRHKYSFRYFGVAEYGARTARPHYHIIFFFDYPIDQLQFTKDIYKEWPYGSQIVIDPTSDDCIGYTLKYCIKMYNNHDPSPKIFLSKRPYIGSGYCTDSTVNFLRCYPIDVVDSIVGRCRIPRIYRSKIYDDDMKERHIEELRKSLEYNMYMDQLEADRQGITYDELMRRRRESFTNKCIQSIKKKKL